MTDISISDLLRYKTQVTLSDDQGGVLAKVWVRILGDYDLQLCYRLSRIASQKKRAALRTPGTPDYEDEIATIETSNSRDECIALIKLARGSNFTGEAYSAIDREEPAKMSEIAVDPDAPTLEEQERLDALHAKQAKDYDNRITQFISDRTLALESELSEKSDKEIYDITKVEVSNILALQAFQVELVDQKVFRSVYKDEKCSKKAFEEIDDYRNAHPLIKDQLVRAYNNLELTPDQIKN